MSDHKLKFEGKNLELEVEMTMEHQKPDSFDSLFKELRPELEADPKFFADAVLVCQGQEFRCHRMFLAARYDPGQDSEIRILHLQ